MSVWMRGIDQINESMRVANSADDDYEKDGLVYCRKCNTPKQMIVPGLMTPVWRMCDCRKADVDTKEAEQKEKLHNEDIERKRNLCFTVREMGNWTFANDDGSNPKLMAIARKFVEHFEEMRKKKRGLLFYGAVGAGKTYASACIANELIDKGYSCYFTSFTAIERRLFDAEDKQEVIDELNGYTLLVIDDLAAERNTDYMRAIVTDVLENRCRSGKPIIVTTNLTIDRLMQADDMGADRIYSRILDLTYPVKVVGEDRRKQKLIESAKEFEKLFGT